MAPALILLTAFCASIIHSTNSAPIIPPTIKLGSIHNQSAKELTIHYEGKTFAFDNFRFDNDYTPILRPEIPMLIQFEEHNKVEITLQKDMRTLRFTYDAPGATGSVDEVVTTPVATINIVTTTSKQPIQTYVTLLRQ
ncbi:MAG: hypothetical protein M1486_03335 [Gammaproteobacteria bacterium]|nr:hypothetical protein [Gammaproteobacteria bacterium]